MIISIAIPCYKSSKTIGAVVAEIRSVFQKNKHHDYQIVLVNDYPFDTTFEVIQKLCKDDTKITGINLSKNYGQTSAKMAAMSYVTGDVLVFMDDDGQHPADGIIPLAEKVAEGYDVVYAHFKEKKHNFVKRFTSFVNAKVLELNGSKQKGIHTSSFFAISRLMVDACQDYQSPFPAMAGFINTVAGKTTEIEMDHRARLEGTSNYSFIKLLKFWLNGFTNFSIVPLRMIAMLGIFIAFCGFGFGAFVVINKIINPAIAAGYASLMATFLFLGGLILVALGFIGEYIGRIYMTVSGLQQYRIREVFHVTNTDEARSADPVSGGSYEEAGHYRSE